MYWPIVGCLFLALLPALCSVQEHGSGEPDSEPAILTIIIPMGLAMIVAPQVWWLVPLIFGG